ncbi:MAG: ATP-binding protein, partial [Deltaproteobacteria bacterium]
MTPTDPILDPRRLQALRAHGVLETPAEASFDNLVGLAARLLAFPMAAVTILDDRRAWVKAAIGTSIKEAPLDQSFCRQVVRTGQRFELDDSRRPEFALHPALAGIHQYAGCPLTTRDGQVLGALCVWSAEPGPPLSERAWADLEMLTSLVMDEIELHAVARDAVERERSIRALVECCPDPIFIQRDGRILFANPSAARYLGVAHPLELTGREIFEFIHPDEHADARAGFKALEVDGFSRTELRRIVKVDSSVVVAEVARTLIELPDGPAVASFMRDLTERREMETRLRLAERLSSLGTLAAGIAHEINNPLSFVVANVAFAVSQLDRLAAGDPEAASDIRAGLADARDGGERIAEIVRGLRTVSRQDVDRVEDVRLEDVIEQAARLAHNELRHRAKLVRQLAPSPRVRANPARLGQLVTNLLLNAAQAMPEGAADQNEIRISLHTDDCGQAILEVTDTGSGISPENQKRVFDPFFTTKPVGCRTGLGLSVCHGIALALGGRIEVESELGRGSTFRVILPPAPAPAASAAPAAPAPVPARARIL